MGIHQKIYAVTFSFGTGPAKITVALPATTGQAAADEALQVVDERVRPWLALQEIRATGDALYGSLFKFHELIAPAENGDQSKENPA